jgi:heterodisulfide reductase subunit C2
MSTNESGTATRHGASAANSMDAIAEKMRACMQCGVCTGSCASSIAMDLTPRQIWKRLQMGLKDEIFNSKTFWMCSACYYCTLRCPRGLPLTENMAALKRAATAEGIRKEKKSPVFYRSFLKTVRRYGRIREAEMMARYFLGLKSPIVPMSFLPLGIKLMMRGKISPQFPSFAGEGKLDKLFRKVEELEANS